MSALPTDVDFVTGDTLIESFSTLRTVVKEDTLPTKNGITQTVDPSRLIISILISERKRVTVGL